MARHPEIPTAHRLTTSFDRSSASYLAFAAQRLGVSQSEVIRRAVALWMKQERRNLEPGDL